VMSKYFRMRLAEAAQPEILPVGFKIISYYPALHRDKIPLIYSDSFQEEPWAEDWDSFAGFDPKGVFLAVDTKTDELVGFIISYERENYGYISVVAIIPKWRRKGVASCLIKTAIRRFGIMEIETILVDVEEGNTPGVNLYTKAGFAVKEMFEE
jgi:ribosomal protein S18 acetylase RimI-like enzyme